MSLILYITINIYISYKYIFIYTNNYLNIILEKGLNNKKYNYNYSNISLDLENQQMKELGNDDLK